MKYPMQDAGVLVESAATAAIEKGLDRDKALAVAEAIVESVLRGAYRIVLKEFFIADPRSRSEWLESDRSEQIGAYLNDIANAVPYAA